MAVAELERIVTRLVTDTRDWTRGFTVAQGDLATFEKKSGSTLGNLEGLFRRFAVTLGASLTVAGAAAFTKQAIEAADAVGDLAAAAGVGVETFQRYQHAVSFSGVTAEQYSEAITTATRTTGAFLLGQEKAVKAFGMLGISANDARIKQMSQDEVLRLLIERLGTYGVHATRASAGAKIFGDAVGPQFVAFAEQGQAKIDELLKQATIFTSEQTRLAAEVNDAWDRVVSKWGVELKGAILSALQATGHFVEGFTLAQVNNEIAKTTLKLEELHRRAELQGAGVNQTSLPDEIRNAEERLRALEEASKRRLAEQKAHDPAEIQRERDEAERQRKEDAARDKAEREAIESSKRIAQSKLDDEKKYLDAVAAYREAEYHRQAELEQRLRDDRREAEKKYDDAIAEYRERKYHEQAEQQKQQQEELAQALADRMTEFATDAERAWEQMKQRIIRVIAELAVRWALSKIGVPADASAQGGGGFFGGAFSGAGATVPMFASGGSPMVGRAALVGERGPELFVPRTAGVVVSASGMAATAQVSPVVVENSIEISVEPGMTVEQRRRRDRDGQERMRIAVRSAVQDDVTRGGTLSRTILSETGQRRAAKRGVS